MKFTEHENERQNLVSRIHELEQEQQEFNEMLEGMKEGFSERLAGVEAERDRLLDSLKMLRHEVGKMPVDRKVPGWGAMVGAISIADDAIKACK